MGILFFALVITIAAIIILRVGKSKPLSTLHSRNYQFFDNFQFLTNDFYTKVEEGIEKREVPNVSVSRINLNQGGMLSAKREYLRVKWGSYTFDICAAPFGTGFFVSWWFGEKSSAADRMPLVGKKNQAVTYYRLDTLNMFKAIVQASFNEAVDSMTSGRKGLRKLSEISEAARSLSN